MDGSDGTDTFSRTGWPFDIGIYLADLVVRGGSSGRFVADGNHKTVDGDFLLLQWDRFDLSRTVEGLGN